MTTHFKALYTTTSLFILISSLSTATPERKGLGFIKDRLVQMCTRVGSWARQEDPEWDALIASFEKERAQVDQSFEEATDIRVRDRTQNSSSKAQQHFIQKIFEELPFNQEEMPEGFSSSLPPEAVQKKSLFLKKAFKGLVHMAYKGTRYAIKHPFKALTLGLLAGRVTTAAAFSSDEFRIDQTDSSQWYAPMARIGDNTFVVWGRNSVNKVAGRIYLPNGAALTDEFDINQNIAPIQVYPDIANVNGNGFVVWGGFVDGNEINARVYLPNGTALTDDIPIYRNATGYQCKPAVADSNNNAFIVWYGYQTGDGDIYGCIVSPTGTLIKNVFRLNQNVAADQTYPAIAAIGGNIFVSWRDINTHGRLFFPNGTEKSDEIRVNQNTTCWQNTASIASLSNGNALVSWSGNADTYMRIFLPNGTAPGDEFYINENTTDAQSRASMASLPNGNVFAVWHALQRAGGNNWDICGRLLSPDGTTPRGYEFRVNQNTTGIQHAASIVIINGNAFVTWQTQQPQPLGGHIYGRILDPSEFFTSTTSSTTTAGITATSNTPPFTRLTRVNSLTRSPITTSSLPFTPPVTGKKKPWKKILIGTGVGAASLVALTAGAALAKKYRSAKKDKVASDSSPDSTFSSSRFPVNEISHDNYGGRTAVVKDVPAAVKGDPIEPPYGLASSVRPPDDNSIYALTPNVRLDDSIYAPTPTRKTAVLDV